jgi:hypothetical protein
MNPFDVPIVFMIFNRPDLTQKVFNMLRQIRPDRLYVVADGPRPSVASDAVQCAQTRAIIETIDWPCELIKDYSEGNLGCKTRPYSGITNAFGHFDRAIILEDDCIPHPDFFVYCRQLLDRYADHKKIMHIGGTQLLSFTGSMKTSYFFSQAPLVWGWATWKRAWDLYDVTIKDWDLNKSQVLDRLAIHQDTKQSIINAIEKTRDGLIDAWDYQWLACILIHEGLCAIPAKNLISNCGFDQRATHTRDSANAFSKRRLSGMVFPMVHPDSQELDTHWNRRWLEKTFSKRKTIYEKYRKKLVRIYQRAASILKLGQSMFILK